MKRVAHLSIVMLLTFLSSNIVSVGATSLQERLSAAKLAVAPIPSESQMSYIEHKLTAPDIDWWDMFGRSIAISGDTAVVGAVYDDIGLTEDEGSAYIFVRNGRTWILQSQLIPSDGIRSGHFGASVDIAGDTVAVGAPGDELGSNGRVGSVYVYTRLGQEWNLQAKLYAPDGHAEDGFGASVDISVSMLRISSCIGVTYFYERSDSGWIYQAQLPVGVSAMDGDTVIVGDILFSGPYNGQGAAIVYRYRNGFPLEAVLTASDAGDYDYFGSSIAFSGNIALIGAPFHDFESGADYGAVYVFTRNGTVWSETARLTASDGAPGDLFGSSVVFDGTTAVIGAHYKNIGQGAVYVFSMDQQGWVEKARLVAPGGIQNGFGYSLDLSAASIMAGTFSGAAYILNPLMFIPIVER